MNITGLISGIVMLMSPSADVELANTIYKTNSHDSQGHRKNRRWNLGSIGS